MSLLLVLLLPLFSGGSLYDQAVSRALATRFPEAKTGYVLLDARTGETIAAHGLDAAAPFGSLIKPFTALAYAQSHGFAYPEFSCRGTASGCWLPRGHGRIGIGDAVAHSCNAYFRNLASQVSSHEVVTVLQRFGIRGLDEDATPETMIGLGRKWQAAPADIARAYSELSQRAGEPGVRELLGGMAMARTYGTGRAVETVSALVKTGTSPCVHTPAMPGDGYVMLLYPAEAPRLALLVRVHGMPGSQAAAIGGKMLRTALEGK